MKTFARIVFTWSILSACNNSIPSGIIATNEMQKIYWDLINADNLAKEVVKRDSTRKISSENIKYLNEVLMIHRISKNELDRSLTYYQRHPDLLGNIFDSLQQKEAKKIERPWDHDKK